MKVDSGKTDIGDLAAGIGKENFFAHASIEAKREKMKQLPAFLTLVDSPVETDHSAQDRQQIIQALPAATSEQLQAIKRILNC